MKSKISILFLFLALIPISGSYSNIDSLKTILVTAKNEDKAIILNKLCHKYTRLNNDSAIYYGNQALLFAKKEGYKTHEANILVALGNTYFDMGKFNKALENYITADKLYSDLKNEKGMIEAATNIGLVYAEQNLFDNALAQYNIVLERAKNTGNKKSYADCLNLLGGLYYQKEDGFKAQKYWEEGYEIYKFLNDIDGIMTCLGNIAVIYQELGNFDKALTSLKTCLVYAKKSQDQKGLVVAYHNIALVYRDKKDYTNAISYLDSCVFIGEKIRDFTDLIETYHTLHEIYRSENKLDKALRYYELSVMAKDSLHSQTQNNQLIEMSIKYDTEKKVVENKLLNQQIELKNVESSRQQIVILLIGVILIVVGVITFILVRQNRLKNKTNKELAEKNHIIQEQHKDITDSIQYSKRIQEAIMPPMHLWEKTLPESFVLYKPKDVLSGDFYWLEKTKDTIYFAACDCTGHGVPGAMVSVICSTALNRAVKEFGLKDTGVILDKVRELVLETFEKSEGTVKDGMDISVCGLNTKTLELKWSGANNPLWYLDKGEAKEITATKQPIGQVDNPVPFTTHTLQLNKNDIIYVFTDGYADQFGGPKGKKFKYKQLKELLVNNANKSMEEQCEILHTAFETWKGNLEQVDDVCVIGVRV